MEELVMNKRDLAGELRESHVNEDVILKGWVQKRRDLGGLIFIDLRDRSGIVQVVFNPEESKEAIEIADTVRNEYVVAIKGKVVKRDPKTFNPEIPTGEIEVMASEIEIINKSKTPPFQFQFLKPSPRFLRN